MRAGLVKKPDEYKWSSGLAHLQGEDDSLVKVEPLSARVRKWQDLLKTDLTEDEKETIRIYERTGRPAGSAGFLSRLEKMTKRRLTKQKPGPKRKN